MPEKKSKKIKKLLANLGIQRISHRQPVRLQTILSDLKDLAYKLGRPWSAKPKLAPKRKK